MTNISVAAMHHVGQGENLGGMADYVSEIVALKAASRLWSRDTSLWSSEPADISTISNRLGWLTTIDLMQQHAAEILAFAAEVRAQGIREAVIVGMGGSSLTPDLFRSIFPNDSVAHASKFGGMRIHVLDTTDPTTILNLRKRIEDPCRTIYVMSSKSGGTIEMTSLYAYFRSLMDECAGDTAGSHFVGITDEGSGLQGMAESEGFRRIFLNPSDIGGRYSALSYFGLVPAALAGVDISLLLDRAAAMALACKPDSEANPALWLGAILGGFALNGRDKLCLTTSAPIGALGGWIEQLIAESTGKRGRGIVPINGEGGHLMAAEAGVDCVYVFLTLVGDDTHDKTIKQLQQAGHPVITIGLNDLYDVGGEFLRWEFATAIAGSVLGVNPFDEPNVLESKQNTKRLLDEFELSGVFGMEATSRSAYGQINKFLKGAKTDQGDYVSLQCYLPYSERLGDLLERLRSSINSKYGVPVTLGYGPRFLHSTGQLHKGGANNMVALQLTYDPQEDLAIPGEPYTFGTLIRAQSLGDFESLRSHERRIMRIHLGDDIGAGLRKVATAVKGGKRRTTGKVRAPRKVKAAPV